MTDQGSIFNPKNIIQGAQVDLVYQIPNPISEAVVDFGTIEVGETITETITITNYWEEQLSGTITSETGFSIADSYTVEVGESINLDIELQSQYLELEHCIQPIVIRGKYHIKLCLL